MPPTQSRELRRQCEKWFAWQGVPHFIAGYNARQNVLTRMARFLAVVFVLEPVVPRRADDDPVVRVLAGVGTAVLVLAVFVVYNVVRGRPKFAPPHRVGLVAVAIFVCVPPLGALAVSGSVPVALQLLAVNLLILLISYLATSYGVVPTAWWAVRQTVGQFRNLLPMAARALPLLLIVMLLAFLTQEVWQIAGTAQPGMLTVALLLLVAIGFVLLLTTPAPPVEQESRFGSWAEIHEAAQDTPAAAVSLESLPDPPPTVHLTAGMMRNLRVVQVVAKCVQVFVVTVLITLAFIVFGMLLLNPQTIQDITGNESRGLLWTWNTPLGVMVASVELILAAVFAGVLSGLQFIISAMTDSQYEDLLSTAADRQLRSELAVLHLYRSVLITPENGT